jgi:hypothetical protein
MEDIGLNPPTSQAQIVKFPADLAKQDEIKSSLAYQGHDVVLVECVQRIHDRYCPDSWMVGLEAVAKVFDLYVPWDCTQLPSDCAP